MSSQLLQKGISAVVPVYNSATTLGLLVERLTKSLSKLSPAYEIILVNDGSADASWETIARLATEQPHVRGLDMMRNYGQHNALLAGLREARFELTVTLDDDLQNPPEEIQLLLEELDKGFCLVYGVRQQEAHGWARDMASVTCKYLIKHLLKMEHAKSLSAFRIFKTELRHAFSDCTGDYVNIDVLLTWATSSISARTVKHESRQAGASGYTLFKLFRHAANMITGFSAVPLRIASFCGFGFTAFGFLVFSYIIIRYFTLGIDVPGFTLIASTICMFSGVQLFALGVIGEYIARIFSRSSGRHPFVVRRSTP